MKRNDLLWVPALIIFMLSCGRENVKVNELENFPEPSWAASPDLVIDANVGLGRFSYGTGAEFRETEKALQHLKSESVTTAVVYSVLSRETDAEEGNRIVIEECARNPGLIPSFVLNPYEMNIDTALAVMKKNNIKVVRLYPVLGQYTVYPSVTGPVMEKLQDAGKVLFIDYEPIHWSSKAVEYNALYQLCKEFPRMPVVLVGSTITGTRNYPNLLKDCKNFYLEINQMIEPGEIANIVRNGYGKRLIFGSGFPLRDPGPILGMLALSGLSQDELRDICSGNLLRLLGVKSKEQSFQLTSQGKRRIIDMHVHQGKINPVPTGTQDADGIFKNMERCGIDAVVVTSLWACFGDVVRGNKAVSDACEKYPGRIYGYITLDPRYPEEVKSQLELYGNNPAFVGIKLHELHQVDIVDPRHDIIYEFADKKGWPLMVHAGMEPAKWEKICTKYRNAHFLMAHFGGMDPRREEIRVLADLAARLKNLYFDCSSDYMIPGAIERLVEIAGAEQVVYGSDFPMFDFPFETGRVIFTNLTEEQKDLILYGNAKRMLGNSVLK